MQKNIISKIKQLQSLVEECTSRIKQVLNVDAELAEQATISLARYLNVSNYLIDHFNFIEDGVIRIDAYDEWELMHYNSPDTYIFVSREPEDLDFIDEALDTLIQFYTKILGDRNG